MSTPSPSPTRDAAALRYDKDSQTSTGWFKSLDSRLSRKKDKTTVNKYYTCITNELLIKILKF